MMRLFQSLLLMVLLGTAFSQDQAKVQCGSGFSDDNCQMVSAICHRALDQLPGGTKEWRWVIVPSDRWTNVARDFGVKPTVPAFSILEARATYLDASLLETTGRIDENLQRYSNRTGFDRLRWVLAHESGHILCQTHDEKVAQRAAGQVEFGGEVRCH